MQLMSDTHSRNYRIVREHDWEKNAALARKRRRSPSSETTISVADSEDGKTNDHPTSPASAGHMGASVTSKDYQDLEKVRLQMTKRERDCNLKTGKDVILRENLRRRAEEQRSKEKIITCQLKERRQESEQITRCRTTPPIKTPYMRLWMDTSEDVQSILKMQGITMSPLDGDRLMIMMDSQLRNKFVNKIMEAIPSDKSKKKEEETRERWRKELDALAAAARGTELSTFTAEQWEEIKEIRSQELHQDTQEKEVIKALNKT